MMEISKSSLNSTQKLLFNRLWETYGDNTFRGTEGNSSLLRGIMNEKDFDIVEFIIRELDFYNDINTTLVGEIMRIISKTDSSTILRYF